MYLGLCTVKLFTYWRELPLHTFGVYPWPTSFQTNTEVRFGFFSYIILIMKMYKIAENWNTLGWGVGGNYSSLGQRIYGWPSCNGSVMFVDKDLSIFIAAQLLFVVICGIFLLSFFLFSFPLVTVHIIVQLYYYLLNFSAILLDYFHRSALESLNWHTFFFISCHFSLC